jgi:hypothetical protein
MPQRSRRCSVVRVSVLKMTASPFRGLRAWFVTGQRQRPHCPGLMPPQGCGQPPLVGQAALTEAGLARRLRGSAIFAVLPPDGAGGSGLACLGAGLAGARAPAFGPGSPCPRAPSPISPPASGGFARCYRQGCLWACRLQHGRLGGRLPGSRQHRRCSRGWRRAIIWPAAELEELSH